MLMKTMTDKEKPSHFGMLPCVTQVTPNCGSPLLSLNYDMIDYLAESFDLCGETAGKGMLSKGEDCLGAIWSKRQLKCKTCATFERAW